MAARTSRFLAARSRLPLYVLPLFAPLALLAARAAGNLVQRRWWLVLPALGVIAVLSLRFAASQVDDDRDSRALAHRVLALTSEPIGELVFLDTASQQGLSFYIDAEVEEVRMDLPPTDLAKPPQTLDEELDEDHPEPDRLWLMGKRSVQGFEAWAAGRGLRAEPLGVADGLIPYHLYRLRGPGQ